MAEVIRGKFGGERKDTPQQPEDEKIKPQPKLPQEGHEAALTRAMAAEQSGDDRALGITVLNNNLGRISEIQNFVRGLGGIRPSNRVLAEAEQYWMPQPTESLAAAARNTTRADWQKNPGLYWALTREWINRILRILDNFPE